MALNTKRRRMMLLPTGTSLLLAFFITLVCLAGCTRKLETRYDSGNIKERYAVQRNAEGKYVKHGEYVCWYENGSKKQEGMFKDAKKDGQHIFWYENGQKKQEGIFKDGTKNGKHIFWYEDGQMKSECEFRDNKKNGKCMEWLENG